MRLSPHGATLSIVSTRLSHGILGCAKSTTQAQRAWNHNHTTPRVSDPQPQGKRTSQCLEKGMHRIFQQQPCWLRKEVFICRTAAASNVSRRKGMTVMALKLLCRTNFTLCQGGDWKDRKQRQHVLHIHFSGKASFPLPSVSPKFIKVMEIIL